MVNRAGQISVSPNVVENVLNATSDSLYLQSFVNIPENADLEIQTTWKLKLNDNLTVQVSTDTWLELGPYDCESPLIGILAEICSHTGTTPVYSIIISISDGYEIITHTWSVQYDVWHPPEPGSRDARTCARLVRGIFGTAVYSGVLRKSCIDSTSKAADR